MIDSIELSCSVIPVKLLNVNNAPQREVFSQICRTFGPISKFVTGFVACKDSACVASFESSKLRAGALKSGSMSHQSLKWESNPGPDKDMINPGSHEEDNIRLGLPLDQCLGSGLKD